MEIRLKRDDYTVTVEMANDSVASEMQEAFDKMLLLMGYIIDVRCSEGDTLVIRIKEEEHSVGL